LRNLSRCGDELPALGEEQWGRNQGFWVEEKNTHSRKKNITRIKGIEKNSRQAQRISPAKNKKKGTNGDDTREKARKRSKSTQITDLQISPHRPLGWTEYRVQVQNA
jgi:hypothetical protein